MLILQQPAADETVSGHFLDVKGLAFAPSGIESVTVQIGTSINSAAHGLFRADVAKTFPKQILLANSGFFCRLTRQKLAKIRKKANDRQVVLSILARARNGETAKLDRELRLEPTVLTNGSSKFAADASLMLNVDLAALSPKGVLKVSGWAISATQIQSIAIYADSELIGNPKIGLPRTDVAHAWPAYANALHSGFSLLTNVRKLSVAPDKIKVVAVDTAGQSRAVNSTVQKSKTSSASTPNEITQTYCDEAILTESGSLRLSGWAIATAGVASIKVFFDGNFIGDAAYGQDRQDVEKKFPTVIGSTKSGFNFESQVKRSEIGTEWRVRTRNGFTRWSATTE